VTKKKKKPRPMGITGQVSAKKKPRPQRGSRGAPSAVLRAAAVVSIPVALIRALRMYIIRLFSLSGLLAAALLLAGLLTWVLALLVGIILVLVGHKVGLRCFCSLCKIEYGNVPFTPALSFALNIMCC
jgi:hypothetical protein